MCAVCARALGGTSGVIPDYTGSLQLFLGSVISFSFWLFLGHSVTLWGRSPAVRLASPSTVDISLPALSRTLPMRTYT